MTVPENALVFDTGPLRHFAINGWLGVLRFIAGERPVLPFGRGGFRGHVLEHGLLDYDQL